MHFKQTSSIAFILFAGLFLYNNASHATAYSDIIAEEFSIEAVDAIVQQYWTGHPFYHHHSCYKYDGAPPGQDNPAAYARLFRCFIYRDATRTITDHWVTLRCESTDIYSRGPTLSEVYPLCPGVVLAVKNLGRDPLASTCDSCVANPIHPATGNKFQRETDYPGSGPYPLAYQRFYNSDPAVTPSRSGHHWRSSYDRSIATLDLTTKRLHRPNGRSVDVRYYAYQWHADPDVVITLAAWVDPQGATIGWRITLPDDSV
jgi:hypothetical protein